jgi:hypothetical protein
MNIYRIMVVGKVNAHKYSPFNGKQFLISPEYIRRISGNDSHNFLICVVNLVQSTVLF